MQLQREGEGSFSHSVHWALGYPRNTLEGTRYCRVCACEKLRTRQRPIVPQPGCSGTVVYVPPYAVAVPYP